MQETSKTISYRGGLVAFEIPNTWTDEYDRDGGGTFYSKDPGSGTLRLNVLSVARNTPTSLADAAKEIFRGGDHQTLPSGNPVRRFVKRVEERGTPLELHRWEVLVPVSSIQLRLACFTHAVLASQSDSVQATRELAIIESAVSTARFATAPAQVRRKAWWQIWK